MTEPRPQPGAAPLPDELPIFPLTGVLLLPRAQLPLNIFEPRYLEMVNAALASSRMIGMVQPQDTGTPGLGVADDAPVHGIGCAGRIVAFQETDDGRYLITLKGVCRFRTAEELPLRRGFRVVRPDFDPYRLDMGPASAVAIDRGRLLASLRAYFEQNSISADWEALKHASDDRLITTLAMVCPFEPEEKQALLESADATHRAKLIIGLIEATIRSDNIGGTAARH